MDNLFLALMLISIGGLIYSIKKKNKKFIVSSVAGVLIFFVAFGMTTDEVKSTDKKEVATKSVKKPNTKETSEDKKEEIKKSPKKEKTVVKKETQEEEPKKEKKKNKEADKPKEEKTKDPLENDKYVEANKSIADDLQMSLGWALGKLDSDGNPTENGTPNEGFNWAIFVEKIEIVEDGSQLDVYVTPEFLTLDNSAKSEVIGYAQNSSMQYTDDFKKLFTVIYEGGKQIGRSTVLEVSDFKFD